MFSAHPTYTVRETAVEINGRKAVSLDETGARAGAPRIVGADVLPGRGMNIYQIRAWFPDIGVVNVLVSPPLEEGREILNLGPGDEHGNHSYRFGAILAPFANRIRGRLLPDGQTIETTIAGRPMQLVANSRGRSGKVEPHAMHGLTLARATDSMTTASSGREARATGVIEAGDFEGHWPSRAHIEITATLAGGTFAFTVTARNTGDSDLPFAEVFPTGDVAPVTGTAYDFSMPGGAPLRQLMMDDCFLDLIRISTGEAVGEIIDPAAGYGIRVRALSPAISAFQVYAPVDRAVVCPPTATRRARFRFWTMTGRFGDPDS